MQAIFEPSACDSSRRRSTRRAQIAAMSAAGRVHLSPVWLERVRLATVDDPVEIACAIKPPHHDQGYAIEAAEALVRFAVGSDDVRVVRAHTVGNANASARVLAKCGFTSVGQVVDLEDGLVWRWEKQR